MAARWPTPSPGGNGFESAESIAPMNINETNGTQSMDDCIFCRIAAGDIPAELIYEDELVVGFRDLNPQAPTHALVIPRKHIATLNDLTADDETIVGRMVGRGASGCTPGRSR